MERNVLLGQYLIWMMLVLGQLHGYKVCIEKERMGLLELKKFVISNTEKEEGQFNKPVFPTWTNDTKSDCCGWEGVKCNRTSGRVIGITIGQLYIYNKKTAPFNLSLLHPFEDIRSLNLSECRFNGLFDEVEGFISLRRLNNLEILDLSLNKFKNNIFPFLNAATSLKTLMLGGNRMDGPFPARALRGLWNLELLDLSGNSFNGSIPVQELSFLRNLEALNLNENKFSDFLEFKGICKLKHLQELNLSKNKFVGQFSLCLTSLSGLRVLDLSSNKLSGKLPSAIGNIKSLEYLSLFDNNLEGFFSLGSLTNLSNLKVLKLSSKSNSFRVVSESSWKPKFHLKVIALRSCNLESVPYFFLHQKHLRHVDLSNNNISGIFPLWLLANNTKLKVLLAQNNCFTSFQLPGSAHNLIFLDASVNEFNQIFPKNIGLILPHLRHMNISKNGFKGNLPASLGNMKSIKYLDISHNSFRGNLPRSFLQGCYSMVILKLSHNKLSGEIFHEPVNFTGLWVLSMDNNLFTGSLRQGLRSLRSLLLLDISNNNFTGVIPSWIGEFGDLYALLISDNSLDGEIPGSLFNLTNLGLLDLSANLLSGVIPPCINSGLTELYLQNNNLSGAIPDALLTNVAVLDLRNNKLSGNIPKFIDVERISVLLLRGNNITGRIPRQFCGLRYIQVLDLSNNSLNGSLPPCLSNTSFGLGIEYTALGYSYDFLNMFGDVVNVDTYFNSLVVREQFSMDYKATIQTKIEFATKHRYDVYIGANLNLFFGLDLSENELSGDIPVDFGGLVELRALNLSHNKLSGVIPESFSGLENVESLDLSFNILQGQIPPNLTNLSSLSVFNVSYNNISGIIPQGKQFNTFDRQSYLGNPHLRGKPTNKSCNSDTFHALDNVVRNDESTMIDMVSFYCSFVAAYVTTLLGIFSSLSFDSPWSRFWFYIVDAFIHKARSLWW